MEFNGSSNNVKDYTDVDMFEDAIGLNTQRLVWSELIKDALKCIGCVNEYDQGTQDGQRVGIKAKLVGMCINVRFRYTPSDLADSSTLTVALWVVLFEDNDCGRFTAGGGTVAALPDYRDFALDDGLPQTLTNVGDLDPEGIKVIKKFSIQFSPRSIWDVTAGQWKWDVGEEWLRIKFPLDFVTTYLNTTSGVYSNITRNGLYIFLGTDGYHQDECVMQGYT